MISPGDPPRRKRASIAAAARLLAAGFGVFRRWEDRNPRLAALLALGAVVLVMGIAYGGRSLSQGVDFRMFHTVAGDVFSGDDLYLKHAEFMYLPIFPLLMHPLSWMNQEGALKFWFVLNVLLIAASFPLAAFVATGRMLPWRSAIPFLVCLLALSHAFRSNLSHGNSNAIILVLIALGLVFYRIGRDVGAGTLFGLAAALKITPALFIVYLAARGSYKAVAAALASLVLFVIVVPSILLGPDRNWTLLEGFYRKMLAPYVNTLDVPHVHRDALQEGQSLPVAATLFLTDRYAARTGSRIHLMALPPRAVQVGARIVCVLLVAGLFALGWRRRSAPREGFGLGLEAALVLGVMLLVSGVSRTGHFVVLAIPLLHFLFLSQKGRTEAGLRRAAYATLLAMGILFLSIAVIKKGIGVPFKALLPYFFITLVLCLGSFVILGRTNPENPPERPPSS